MLLAKFPISNNPLLYCLWWGVIQYQVGKRGIDSTFFTDVGSVAEETYLILKTLLPFSTMSALASTLITHKRSRKKKTTEIKETYARGLLTTPFWVYFRLELHLLSLLSLLILTKVFAILNNVQHELLRWSPAKHASKEGENQPTSID